MELLDEGRDTFVLSQYRGNALLLNIFATWCGPCNQEQPGMVDAAAAYAAGGLVVVGIDAGDSDDSVRAYRKKYGITYPIAMDRDRRFAYALERGRPEVDYPASLFFNPSGTLYGVVIGGMGQKELTYRIERFLAQANPEGKTQSPSPPPLQR